MIEHMFASTADAIKFPATTARPRPGDHGGLGAQLTLSGSESPAYARAPGWNALAARALFGHEMSPKPGEHMTEIQVIGGGIAGLVAAVECAERGAAVTLHELTGTLGGRARSLNREGFVTNQGPHAFYGKGPAEAWLSQRSLLPPLIALPPTQIRVRYGGRTRALPLRLLLAISRLRSPAPEDVAFGAWARLHVSDRAAKLVEGCLTLPLYDGEPGRHAAASVQTVMKRTQQRNVVRYIKGGWNELVDRLSGRAVDLGVEIRLGSRVDQIAGGQPSIVCVSPRAAERLLGPSGWAEGQMVALRDIGITQSKRSRQPAVLLDVDLGVYVARYSELDRSLAPAGHDLLQCAAGLRPGEPASAAQQRIEQVLDAGYPRWRSDAVLDHHFTTASPGVRDRPGTTWRHRPSIAQREMVFLAGDWVAAPGFLSEVCFTSATMAAEQAVKVIQGRSAAKASAGS